MSTEEGPVIGDGKITIEVPIPEREHMAIDLEPGVAQAILNSGVNAHQFLMTAEQGNIQTSNNITRLTAAKKFDELGTAEGKAVQGVTAVPHGAPVGPNGGA